VKFSWWRLSRSFEGERQPFAEEMKLLLHSFATYNYSLTSLVHHGQALVIVDSKMLLALAAWNRNLHAKFEGTLMENLIYCTILPVNKMMG